MEFTKEIPQPQTYSKDKMKGNKLWHIINKRRSIINIRHSILTQSNILDRLLHNINRIIHKSQFNRYARRNNKTKIIACDYNIPFLFLFFKLLIEG